uniref:glutaminase n=1 Tax=Hippocampus comes TaxID=109280 RepID=A0A3Q2XPP5_HIPCM
TKSRVVLTFVVSRLLSGFWSSNVAWKHPMQTHQCGGLNDYMSSPQGSSKKGILPSLEDLLFYTIAEGQEKIPAHKFTTALKSTGLRTGDPRLKECMEMLKVTMKTTSDGALDRHLFKKCVQSNIVLLTQAFRKKFVIPDFQPFCRHIGELYDNAKNMSGGQVADYIPQLARFSPDLWAVSLCTVDGQRHTVGDTKVPFCLQSCVKPLKYAIAVHDHGTEYVHRFIGKEPSGLRFNKLFLNEDDKPHNPMVNAGAIVCTSLIKVTEHTTTKSMQVMNFMNKLAGNEYVGFSNATFQSERESGDRNFAIGYYLKEKKCFPEGTDMTSILDFYFQVKSVINLLFAAYTGDVSALRRFALSSMDMEQRDYDSRTALHVAAAEGHAEVVRFLLEACKVNPVPRDRWGNTPMDEAVHFGHHDVVTILRDYHNLYSPPESPAAKENAEKNLDSML